MSKPAVDKKKRDMKAPSVAQTDVTENRTETNRTETASDGAEIANRILTDGEIAKRLLKRSRTIIDVPSDDGSDADAKTTVEYKRSMQMTKSDLGNNDAETQKANNDVTDGDDDCRFLEELSLFQPTTWEYEEMSQPWDF